MFYLACQYGNHYKVVNSNTFLDTRRDWEAIQEFGGRLYMNHLQKRFGALTLPSGNYENVIYDLLSEN